VAGIVRVVESKRGLKFDHPVAVEFLSDGDFNAKVTNAEMPSAEERADMDNFVSTLRALGLVSGSLDLQQASNTLFEQEILGLYDSDAKAVYVKGSTMTPDVKETVAHELTHALQDQHFDLDRFDDAPDGVQTAYRALFEADAIPSEQQSVTDTRLDQVQDARKATEGGGVPDILGDLLSFPYAFGPAFVLAVEQEGGNKAIDRAFEKPPRSEAQILDPKLYLTGADPVKVDAPKLTSNQQRVDDPDDFGQLSMAMVLGRRLDFGQAWPALQGWAGDQYVIYREGGGVCVAVDTVLRAAPDADRFLAAASAWSAAMPAATATRLNPTTVELRSCDPGSSGAVPQASRPSLFEVLAMRSEFIAAYEDIGAPLAAATCAADRVLAEIGTVAFADLANIADENDPRVKRVQPIAQRAAAACSRAR
jgi:hypothetical protein